MFERMMKGGPVKAHGVRAVELDTPTDAGDVVPGGRGFVKNFGKRNLRPTKPEDEAAPEGWKMGPVARMGMRRLGEPGLRGRGF